MIKNMFCIFCAFCLLCTPCFSENIHNKYSTGNKYPTDTQTISVLNLNNINRSFRSNNPNNIDYSTPQTFTEKKELEALKISKGTKFLVKSKQDVSNFSNNGSKIVFESVYPEKIIPNTAPSKLVFKGNITKTRNPQLAGSSALVKIKIDKMVVGNISYPVNGLITKINNKPVYFNSLKGDSSFLANTFKNASIKSGVLSKVYKDPCDVVCEETNAFISPLYLLSGAILQTSNLVLSPVGALFKTGKDLYIKNNSDFVIKLADDVFILKI